MENQNDIEKLSTGIDGLDDLFYGGIQLKKELDSETNSRTEQSKKQDKNGLLALARGEHGVNKIHLAMQMCEGMYISLYQNSTNDYQPLDWEKNLDSESEKIIKHIEENFDNLINGLKEIATKAIDKNIEPNNNFDSEKEMKDFLKKWQSETAQWNQILTAINDYDKATKDVRFTDEKTDEKKELIRQNIAYQILLSIFSLKYKKEGDSCFSDSLSEEEIRNNIFLADKQHLQNNTKLLFISLNKDRDLLKNSYYDFYIQRLIKKIRIHKASEKEEEHLYKIFGEKCKDSNNNIAEFGDSYNFPSIKHEPGNKTQFINDIATGLIYYNSRTHGLHLYHQAGTNNDSKTLLCTAKFPEKSDTITIIGRDELCKDNPMANGLTLFLKMMEVLDHSKAEFIMIDGLSCLTKEEIKQCPFAAFSTELRKKCKFGIITADEKLAPSDIRVDIIIDMAIKEGHDPDHLYHALKISKCLYQKNAYGWHNYKMRKAGIEVIPSIHMQMISRYHMDDAIPDALLPINEYPYHTLIDENKEVIEVIDKSIEELRNINNEIITGNLKFTNDYDKKKRVIKSLINGNDNYILWIEMKINQKEVYYEINNIITEPEKQKHIHFFKFRPGYIKADDFLYTIDQQVQAIARKDLVPPNKRNDFVPPDIIRNIHVIINNFNFITSAYPCLTKDDLLLPALFAYTNSNQMTNYIFSNFTLPADSFNFLKSFQNNINKKDRLLGDLKLYHQLQQIAEEL
jgi:hypothetical protein